MGDPETIQDGAERIADAVKTIRERAQVEPLVRVARSGPGGTWAFLSAITPEQADEIGIFELFGGGTYRVQVAEPVSKRIAGQAVFTIFGEPRSVAAPSLSSVPKPHENNEAVSIISLLEKQGSILAALAENLKPAAPVVPAASSFGSLSEAVGLITALQPIFHQAPAQGLGIKDFLELSAALKGKEAPRSSFADSVETFRLFRELEAELGGGKGAGEGEGMAGLLAEILPTLREVLKDSKEKRLVPRPLAKEGPEIIDVTPKPEEVGELTIMEKMVLEQLKANASTLADLAATKSPEDAALDVFATVPPVAYDFLRRSDAVPLILAESPLLAKYETWLTGLRDALLRIIDEPDDGDPAPPKPPAKKPPAKAPAASKKKKA